MQFLRFEGNEPSSVDLLYKNERLLATSLIPSFRNLVGIAPDQLDFSLPT